MEDFIINSQTIKPGEFKQIVLNSYELHTKTKIEIPVFVSRSKKRGLPYYCAQVCMAKKRMALKLSEK